MRITVLSTFDIWPPRDGGQTRYVNLWPRFSREHEIKILVYDFRNLASERRYWLDEHVEVIVPAASEGDQRHFLHTMERTGLWLHDVLCISQYAYSDGFLRRARELAAGSDVIVASHPYLAGAVFPLAADRTMLVYESHNVEYDIKADYFAGGTDRPLLDRLLADVEVAEGWAARVADLVTAVSRQDGDRLAQLYGVVPEKVRIVPNGANIRSEDLLSAEERDEARKALGIDGRTAGIFLGSAYAANVESYRRARDLLQAARFDGVMLLVGSIDKADRSRWPAVDFEERWYGFVTDELRDLLLASAHFALHLMFAGAGTNLKLFDYMGAGTPIIANVFGSRGVTANGWHWTAETSSEFSSVLNAILADEANRQVRTAIARRVAKDGFDWKAIARGMASLIDLRLDPSLPASRTTVEKSK